VQRRGRFEKVEVTSDGSGLASHAGSAVLVAVADKVGLTDALAEALAPTRGAPLGAHPGEVVRDLCVMLADGGDCLADLGALRDQRDLFGRVASNATAFRVVDSLCAEGMLERLRAARAKARERVWRLGGRPERIVLDLDATLITSHSDKEEAPGNFKGGFGFHPMLCYLDESGGGARSDPAPGQCGRETAADQIECVEEALGQLPREVVALLARRPAIGLEDGVDQHPVRAQPRRRPEARRALSRRQRRGQRLPDRPPLHPMTARQLTDREPLPIPVASDLLEQLHSARHPFRGPPCSPEKASTLGTQSDGGGAT
jgi:Transposase DDE domain group 1